MKLSKTLTANITLVFLILILPAGFADSQVLPDAKSIAEEMGIGWNIGNTMEAIGGPTSWGNPVPAQKLIDSVKAAGFKTIRIPCAWDGNADQTTLEINAEWMALVKQVVDYCIKDSLFVVLNIHWDGGWLENRIDSAVTNTQMREQITKKQAVYWRQIATIFRHYDRHLLFASTNEPNVKDAVAMNVLKSFHQTFIDTVRAAGGNNASRTLVIQGPKTALEDTYKLMTTLPTDIIDDRLMVEVHYYPYQFCLMSKDESWGKVFYYWGQPYKSTTDTDRNSTWGEESYTDSVFNLMKMAYTDNDIPVLLGEFGAMKRLTLTGDSLERHILSRRYFYQYVVSSSKQHGIIPVAWDAGGKGDGTMTIFDRKTGTVYDLGLLNAIRYGWGMAKLPGDTSLVQVATGDNSMKILYSSKDSLSGQVSLPIVKHDITEYDSIIVMAFVNGEFSSDSAGTTINSYMNLHLVTMSKEWTWRQAPLGTLTMNKWGNYAVPLSNDTTNEKALVPADPAQIDMFAVQVYSKGYRGTIYIDWIVFKSNGGVSDTVYNFNLTVPEEGNGNVEAVKIISTSSVDSDQEWKKATQRYPFESAVNRRSFAKNTNVLRIFTVNKSIVAQYQAFNAGVVNVALNNLQGKTVTARLLRVHKGINSFKIPGKYSGVMILQIIQGDKCTSSKVICN